jgi:hypothetical protein
MPMETKPRKAAIVTIAPELLCDLLAFPPGARIAGARLDPFTGVFELLVEHDDLPRQLEGSELRRVSPVYRAHRSPQEFVSWGI